jgi:hypothetical protein
MAYAGGTFTDSIGHYTAPAHYTRTVTSVEIDGSQDIRIVIEFTSDPNSSDEDCFFASIWGSFGLDDMTVIGGGINASYDFEDGLQGWTPGFCDQVGGFVDIVDVGCYPILDPCTCPLDGNVTEMHAGLCNEAIHPTGQHVEISSPFCDVGSSDPKEIILVFDMYAELPLENGVLFRPGW